MKKLVPTVALGFATVLWAGAVAPAAAQERIGTSTSDESVNYAAFSIYNSTTGTLIYQIRWGNEKWKKITLKTGETGEHRYRLGSKAAPSPQIRFDRIVGDREYTEEYYDLDTKQISKGGFGPPGRGGTPKAYVFKASADRRNVDLHAVK